MYLSVCTHIMRIISNIKFITGSSAESLRACSKQRALTSSLCKSEDVENKLPVYGSTMILVGCVQQLAFQAVPQGTPAQVTPLFPCAAVVHSLGTLGSATPLGWRFE